MTINTVCPSIGLEQAGVAGGCEAKAGDVYPQQTMEREDTLAKLVRFTESVRARTKDTFKKSNKLLS